MFLFRFKKNIKMSITTTTTTVAGMDGSIKTTTTTVSGVSVQSSSTANNDPAFEVRTGHVKLHILFIAWENFTRQSSRLYTPPPSCSLAQVIPCTADTCHQFTDVANGNFANVSQQVVPCRTVSQQVSVIVGNSTPHFFP